MDLKELYSKWNSISLIVRILCGLAIGLVLALIIPGYSYISVFGEIFVSALKAIAPLLVMFLVIGSLSTSGSGLGSRFKLVIVLYLASTIIAAVVATALGFINPVTVFLDTSSSTDRKSVV